MKKNLIYDASRLITRVLNETPNGIDRIDLFLAKNILSRPDSYALRFGLWGPSLFDAKNFPDPVRKVELVWREQEPHTDDLMTLHSLTNRLLDIQRHPYSNQTGFNSTKWERRILNPIHNLLSYAFLHGENPTYEAPKGSIFLNATHFPIEWRSHVMWLKQRPDIAVVLFIHDLLPIKRAELFWSQEPQRHLARLELLAQHGAAALVTTSTVEEALTIHLKNNGRSGLPIFCAPPPVNPIFLTRPLTDENLSRANYFIICGTIEPRKNHLLLVDVWRRLKSKLGLKTPKLVVVGKRGWKAREIFNELYSVDIESSIIVVSGLPTSIYKTLLAHAAGLLAPSVAEGLGLPIGEALALGVPVIASDIEGHREYPREALVLLDPARPEIWVDAIVDAARRRHDGLQPRDPVYLNTQENYTRELNRFMMNLP